MAIENGPDSSKGRVLVMDDEEAIRDLAKRILDHFGYEVETVRDGVDAFKKYRNAMDTSGSFDVVILDLTIPGGMGGSETFKKLIEIDPQVKAIVSSGFSNDPHMSEYRKYGFKGVIMKPFRIDEINEAVKKAMEE